MLLDLRHAETGQFVGVRTERLIMATGYAQRTPHCLAPIDDLITRDSRGRMAVGRDVRVELAGSAAGLYLQNAELHSHGGGTPDLGLGAFRAATILNAVARDAGFKVPCYRLPSRTAHTAFDPAVAAASGPGMTVRADPAGSGSSCVPGSGARQAAVRPQAAEPADLPAASSRVPGPAARAPDSEPAADLPAATTLPPAGRVGRQGPPAPQPAVSRTGNRT